MKRNLKIWFLFALVAAFFVVSSADTFAQAGSKGKIVTITPVSFDKNVSQKGVVVVDYWAPWCAPCKKQDVVLRALVNESDVTVAKMNADTYKKFALEKQGVVMLPTMVVYVDGQEKQRLTGFYSKEQLLQLLSSFK